MLWQPSRATTFPSPSTSDLGWNLIHAKMEIFQPPFLVQKFMTLRAETENKFLYKYLLIGIATLAFSCWAFYDASVNYPSKIPKAAAYDKLRNDDSLTNIQRQEQWDVIAAENGWPEQIPEKSVEEIHYDINWNWIFGGVAALIGVPNLVWFLRNRGTWLEMDGNTITNSQGQTVELSQATELDKKKWVKKGIALLKYKSDDGTEKTFVLDDMKYQRGPVDEMMAQIEETIGIEKVVNGPTEANLAEQAAKKKAERQKRLAEAEADSETPA